MNVRRSGDTPRVAEKPVPELHWRLHTVMSERGIRTASELHRRLVGLDVPITHSQVCRTVTHRPERLSIELLAALMHTLDCSASDLLQAARKPAAASRARRAAAQEAPEAPKARATAAAPPAAPTTAPGPAEPVPSDPAGPAQKKLWDICGPSAKSLTQTAKTGKEKS